MVSKRRTRRKRGGSGEDKTTHVQGQKSSPLAPIGGMIRMMSDMVGGLIKGTGDGIAGAMGASDPKGGDKETSSSSDVPQTPTIDTPKIPDGKPSHSSHSSHKKGGGRTKKRKKHKKRKSRKRPKGSRADITPISREWQVKNHPIQINRFANDPTIPDRGEKFDELVHEMRHSGLTDGYFVIDYNSRRSPGHYGKYLISFSEALDDNLLPDATNYTGGYADNISAYELRQLRLRNERLERERQAEIERERLAELERQRELEREMAEAESLGLTLRELRTTRRMERIAEEEERQRRLQREMRQHYFENLPENEDVIVIEDPDGDINLGIEYKKPPTPQNEIPVTRPSFFQRMRSVVNTLRRNRRNRRRRSTRSTRVRPTAEGNKKKITRQRKRKKHKRKRTKKK